MFPTFKLTARPDDFVRLATPRPVPSGYWRTPSGAIRRDKARRVKLNPDSHHNATRRRARKLFRKGAAVPQPD